ncbi:hypothetical protein [Corynebacterium striatum]|uniref:hypothetical protein n=1 Tax=Corynebacterium striatum TaxID=43770 RepID=UPI000A3D7B7D|nr:hypothetical protein [Corynebacterium striatum]
MLCRDHGQDVEQWHNCRNEFRQSCVRDIDDFFNGVRALLGFVSQLIRLVPFFFEVLLHTAEVFQQSVAGNAQHYPRKETLQPSPATSWAFAAHRRDSALHQLLRFDSVNRTNHAPE